MSVISVNERVHQYMFVRRASWGMVWRWCTLNIINYGSRKTFWVVKTAHRRRVFQIINKSVKVCKRQKQYHYIHWATITSRGIISNVYFTCKSRTIAKCHLQVIFHDRSNQCPWYNNNWDSHIIYKTWSCINKRSRWSRILWCGYYTESALMISLPSRQNGTWWDRILKVYGWYMVWTILGIHFPCNCEIQVHTLHIWEATVCAAVQCFVGSLCGG